MVEPKKKPPDPTLQKIKARMIKQTDQIGEMANVLTGRKPLPGALGKAQIKKNASKVSFDQFLKDVASDFSRITKKKPTSKIKIRKL